MLLHPDAAAVEGNCYIDTSDRIFDTMVFKNNENSVDKCAAACGAEGFKFAGVQHG